MSTIMMARCWPLALPMVAKSVLISLADQANDQGVCWPSVATICKRVCSSERAVRNALRTLEQMGLLDVRLNARRSNEYTIHPERYREPNVCAVEVQTPEAQATTPAPRAPRHLVPPGTTCRSPRHHVPPNHQGTNTNTPPIPPRGEHPLDAQPPKVQASAHAAIRDRDVSRITGLPLLTLPDWLAVLKQRDQKPISADGPIWDYAIAIGLDEEMVKLHWWEFRDRYTANKKRHADWTARLLDSFKGNWFHLWRIDGDGVARLTTQGLQARKVREVTP